MTGCYQVEAVMRGKVKVWYGGGEVKLPFPPLHTSLSLSAVHRPQLLTSSSSNTGRRNLHAPPLSVPSRPCAEAMAYGMIW